MKKYFVLNILFAVLLTSKGCLACFQEDTEMEHYVQAGTPFFYECACTEVDHTADDLQWVDMNGDILNQSGPGTGSAIYTEKQGNALDLLIPNAGKAMSGTYKCITNFGGTVHTQTLKVNVYDPVMFINTKTNQYLTQGNDSLIECHAVGDYDPVISWYKDYTEIDYDSGKYLQVPNGLLVRNVTKEDAYIYKCSANQMRVGAEVDTDIKVEIMTMPVITDLYAMPSNVVVAGSNLKIKCVAEGWPSIQYYWNKTLTYETEEGSNVTWTQIDNIIDFEEIRPEDEGTYVCYASNIVGVARKTISIDVLVGPEILNFTDITRVEGTNIGIFCNATGKPEPDVTIVYKGKNLTEDESYTQYKKLISNLSIMKVDRSDEGFYVCNATNEVNFKTEIMYLKVLHRPYFKEEIVRRVWGWNGHTVNLSCAHDSSPTANITWRYEKGNTTVDESSVKHNTINTRDNTVELSFSIHEGFSYGIYTCIVVNEYGKAVRTFELEKGYPPSEVLNASSIEVTASTATFSIETPTNYIGPDVIGFRAEYDEASNYNITDIHLNRTWSLDRPFKLERLKPNTTYFVRFAAVNLVGTGKWSEMIEFDTLERSAPEAPIWPEQALKIVSNKHLLTWKAPYDNGEPIDYYVLQYCPMYDRQRNEKLCKLMHIPPSTELELNDLEYNTTYYLELVAHNSEGNSSTALVWINVPALMPGEQTSILSAGAIIGISVIVVAACLIILDLVLFFWRRQGIIASCCNKENKKKSNKLNSRDKKGLLKDNRETTAEDTLKRPNNGHKEYEYNKTTGIITGKHSSV